ncbi:transcriptional regulator, TetR family [Maridesulfovibrio ferrireducens]|uniref:Transcriptional regulator, TetR family n=1 Tax=Maridesulfovibrio ferrireducens TaxID=246191 RepID=A0A1G9LIR9_9BACT|nr:TetR/AcrR family transcriptional regulator [Maridesulfovibrio ferrireducens]SDL61830.1 transcriptional regulator, TetR family [Maridesulfovibrio ferrireducens]
MTKKEIVLKTAKEIFGELGYSGTTFKKIADRAGVAVGLLSHHYGNKEKLFKEAGFDVAERLSSTLQDEVLQAENGYDAVYRFAKRYLEFSIDPDEDFLVLVRCSPFSDLKTGADRDAMVHKFAQIPVLLENCVARGVRDGSIPNLLVAETASVVLCNLVGAVRTKLLTPYSPPKLYAEALKFMMRSLKAA